MPTPTRILPLMLAAGCAFAAPAQAADYDRRIVVTQEAPVVSTTYGYGYHKGRYTPTTYDWKRGNHPWKAWKYPSTYPWAQPVVYNAGPGNYYPAHRARLKQARSAPWTGYPPRHLYVTDYNGYAPQYGFYPH